MMLHTKIMGALVALFYVVTLAALPSCNAFVTDPETGETVFSAEGAALDARTMAIVARESSTVWTQADPELAVSMMKVADQLEGLAVVFDIMADGEDEDPTEQIGAVLTALDLIAQRYVDDPDTLQKISAAIATIRIGLLTYRLNFPEVVE